MGQQLTIIVMVDVEAAIKANTLDGNTYLFDDMKFQGSEGEGTGDLVTAINGTYWSDGSQANEQVLNWVPWGLGAIPPTVPRTFHADRSNASDLQGLKAFADLPDRIENTEKGKFKRIEDVVAELKSINKQTGVKAKVKSKRRDVGRHTYKIMDVTGELLSASEETIPEISHITPIITDITGEAVDKKVIYPAEYGSPDLQTDGWYWSATVATSRPGTYAYTMHIQLYELSCVDGEWTWEPVHMTYQSHIKVTCA